MTRFFAGERRTSLYGFSALPAISRDPEEQKWLNEHVNFPPRTPVFTELEPRAYRRASRKALRAAERVVRREARGAKIERMGHVVKTENGSFGVAVGITAHCFYCGESASDTTRSVATDTQNVADGRRAVRAANRAIRSVASRVEEEIFSDARYLRAEVDAIVPKADMASIEQAYLPPDSGANLL